MAKGAITVLVWMSVNVINVHIALNFILTYPNCGVWSFRFVELLWHLSAHALREVHRRTFPADVAANPLPASLTELVGPNTRPASLLGITKVSEWGL